MRRNRPAAARPLPQMQTMTDPVRRSLVIAPQAGLGNRLRAISAAMVLARQLDRDIFHAWFPVTPNDSRAHVAALQRYGYGKYFAPNDALPRVDRKLPIDLCFSELRPGEPWYQEQSTAQRALPVKLMAKVQDPAAEAARRPDANIILLETSHCLRLEAELGGCADDDAFTRARHDAYQSLAPQPQYLDWLQKLPKVDIGIAIRRGDMLQYAREANQSLDDIRAWVVDLAKDRRVTVFSDDADARRYVQDAIPGYHDAHGALERALGNVEKHQSAFLQFLYLANHCGTVCGTPVSSFAEEAAVFGGKRYFRILAAVGG